MEQDDFKDWEKLYTGKSELVARKVNSLHEPFLSSNIVHLQVHKDKPGILQYKESFQDMNFKEISFKRNLRKMLQLDSAAITPCT